MSNSDAIKTDRQSLGKLALRLIAVLFCGFLPPIGIYLVISGAFASNQLIGGGFEGGWILMGIIFILGAPILVGLSLQPGSHGVWSGFLGIVWVLIIYLVFIFGFLDFLEKLFPHFNSLYAFAGLIILGTVVVILVNTSWVKSRNEYAGLFLGLLIGGILALLPDQYISNLTWAGFGPLIISFPAVWLSAVFFPALFSNRLNWTGKVAGALVWAVLMVIPVFIALLGPVSP